MRCVLLCIAVAITPAFRMRFWNIGAEGQTLIGGLATAAIMIYLGDTASSAVLFLVDDPRCGDRRAWSGA